MSQYFKEFPLTTYNNVLAKNITLRTKFLEKIKSDATLFYSYTLEDGQTAESIAYDYYGDSNYIWLIYLTNDIIDPYYGWHLSTADFEKYIINKYGSIQDAQSQILYYKKLPIDYYTNNQNDDFVLASAYDPLINGYGWTKITVDDNVKINSIYGLDPAIWSAVDAYTHEQELNEDKRNIKLLDLTLLSSIDRQFKELMNVR
jgi:hypothetical protein